MSKMSGETCSDVEVLLSAYLDDELAADQRDRVDAHLTGCAECSSCLKSLRQVNTWIKADWARWPPRLHSGNESSLPQVELRHRDAQRAWLRSPLFWGAGISVAVAVLFIAVVSQNFSEPSTNQETAHVMQPTVYLYELNRHAEADQQVMLNTMELAVRAMKMELGVVESDDLTQVGALNDRVANLLQRIEQVRTEPGTQEQGLKNRDSRQK